MKQYVDLHMHSKYARACSPQLDLPNIEKYARIKGLTVVGTGDISHPKWNEEIRKELIEDGTGILKSKTGFNFVLQGEISLMYSQGGKGRKIHYVYLVPDLDTLKQVNSALIKKGRLDYDGRPIFGMSSIEFVDMMIDISKDIEIIAAHCWTPWFGLFGSMSGFNSVEECFGERAKYIHALETGLSSDPMMNWRISSLDKYSLVSFSDSHSYWPWRMGREATIMDIKLTYKELINAIRTKKGLVGTIEVDPNFGKYHFTGHRNCNVSLDPNSSKKFKDICPNCGKKMTVGVLQRVEELADRPEGTILKDAVPFYSLIPLSELISVVLRKSVSSKEVWQVFYALVNGKTEIEVLLETPYEELRSRSNEKLAESIIKNREGKIKIKPGYDGVYGIPIIDEAEEQEYVKETEKIISKYKQKQKGLQEFIS